MKNEDPMKKYDTDDYNDHYEDVACGKTLRQSPSKNTKSPFKLTGGK